MITLTSLSKIYRTNEIETVALENVNLKVDRGEFLSIIPFFKILQNTSKYKALRSYINL